MEITLKAKVELWLYRTVDVNSIDELRAAEVDFDNDSYQMGRFKAERGELEFETGNYIDGVTVADDDGYDHGNVEDYIDEIYDDPDHPLHGTADIREPVELDELDDKVCQNDDEHADGSVDSVDPTAAPSNIMRIPKLPKNTRRAGLNAVKHAFKKIASRF